ncbi:MAG: hypothetical protein MHM6MM_000122 [Cercozoa sp. M6MM]
MALIRGSMFRLHSLVSFGRFFSFNGYSKLRCQGIEVTAGARTFPKELLKKDLLRYYSLLPRDLRLLPWQDAKCLTARSSMNGMTTDEKARAEQAPEPVDEDIAPVVSRAMRHEDTSLATSLLQMFRVDKAADVFKQSDILDNAPHCLVANGQRRRQPRLLVRDGSIVLHLGNVTAVIRADRSVVLHATPSKNVFVDRNLLPMVHDWQNVDRQTALPFEFIVLECALSHAVNSRRQKRDELFQVGQELLPKIGLKQPVEVDSAVLEFKMRLANQLHFCESLLEALNELLKNDEDMSQMYLTHYREHGHARDISDHDELELLLEHFVSELEEVHEDLENMRDSVYNVEKAVRLQLDRQRNEILKFDLRLQVIGTAAAVSAFGAGVFGMNLLSGLEEHPHMFWSASAALGSLIPLSMWSARLVCRYRNIVL